ncbi:MAG: biopolymer transporter ExbD [Bacteroidales bacterium]|nr:biopolymer transporter ExbD [Bacteroidales bacterium]
MARKIPQLNMSSTADISFLLLTFFLLTSSINTDKGLSRMLPPLPDPNAKPPIIKERNVFTVLVNTYDQLLVEGKPGDIRNLRKQVKEFIANPYDDPNLSEGEIITLPHLGQVRKSKGVISLQNDRGTSYDMYIKVQNELAGAIYELRDELAQEKLGRSISQISDQAILDEIQKAVPMSISEAEPKAIGGK